jgi:hypothetical protein
MSRGHWLKDNIVIDTVEVSEGSIAIVMSNDDMRAQQIPFSYVAVWREEVWLAGGSPNWDALAIVNTRHPFIQLVVIGPHGNVHLTGSGDRHEEMIADGDFSPAKLSMLRGARTIEGLPLVCGMKKQVYLREDAHQWRCISKEIAGGPGVHGFEAIDGFSLNDIYAVGWAGEVWHYNGADWTKIDIPETNLLTDVCCAGDGMVYIIGRGGTFIVGKQHNWQVYKIKEPVELVSLCWFNGMLYAASLYNIFTCSADGRIEPVDIPGDYPETCGKLAPGTNSMLSAGERDWFTFDGTNWKRID